MNKRVKELIEQATIEVRSHGAFGEIERYNELDPEKFAELIVRECMSDCEAVKEQFYNGVIATNDPKLKGLFEHAEAVRDMIKTKIEMRFGVE